MKPVLIVEDDPDIAEGLRYNLEREGLEARVTLTGEQGLAAALDAKSPPALVILDLMLPGMSGSELCRRLRREPATRRTPIIMLTARTSEAERVAGLDLGADDYISKPFSVRELMARVRAVLRRTDENTAPRYEDTRLTIDFADMRVACDGASVRLTRKEFALLAALARGTGRVATRQQLLDNVWGYEYYGDTRTLDVHIRRLRQKLGDCGDAIETVVGVGYRFVGCSETGRRAADVDERVNRRRLTTHGTLNGTIDCLASLYPAPRSPAIAFRFHRLSSRHVSSSRACASHQRRGVGRLSLVLLFKSTRCRIHPRLHGRGRAGGTTFFGRRAASN